MLGKGIQIPVINDPRTNAHHTGKVFCIFMLAKVAEMTAFQVELPVGKVHFGMFEHSPLNVDKKNLHALV